VAGIYINDLTISLLDLDDPHCCSGHGKRTKGKGKGRYAPLLYSAPIPMFPLEFRGEVKRQKTKVMGLLCGEGCI